MESGKGFLKKQRKFWIPRLIKNGYEKLLQLDYDLLVSDWADKERILTSDTSAESGRWKTSRTPYLREIMNCLSPSHPCRKVVFMKGAQIGGTEAGLNWLGFIIHCAPGPTLVVNPSIETSKRNSKMRLAPMVENTPALAERITSPRAKDSGNTIFQKDFPGGSLIMTGANAPSGLRSVPIRYLFLDEIDEYPKDAGTEGDPVDLAIQRTATFANRKIFMISTPTIKDLSRIEQAFLEGDQRYYEVPCPYCDHYQVLRWANIMFDSKNCTEAVHKCEKCGELWHDWQKEQILSRGRWVARRPENTDVVSFHLSSLYSPHGWLSWTDIAKEFLLAKDEPTRLQVWTNTKLAESWEDMAGDAIDPTNLVARAEYFGDELPAGVCILTCGVDVQDNRLEIEIVGWGRGEESWSIDYQIIYGDPSTPELWAEMDRVLARRYKHAINLPDLHITATCIDSGGHYADQVVSYCHPRRIYGVFAIKGDGGFGKPIWPTSASKNAKTKKPVYMIGVNDAKDVLMRRLHGDTSAGQWHFPRGRDIEWFEQLTNEIVRKKFSKGRLVREWQPRKAGVRTEALDCRVYAYAALRALVRNYKLNLDEIAAKNAALSPNVAHRQPAQNQNAPAAQQVRRVRRVRSRGIEF